MTEDEFNAEMRAVLRAQDMRALHVRETDTPGISDLLIWRITDLYPHTQLWMELKEGRGKTRSAQHDFMFEEHKNGSFVLLVHLTGDKQVTISRPHSRKKAEYVILDEVQDFRLFDWKTYLTSITESNYVDDPD